MEQTSFEGINPTEVIPAPRPNRGRGRPRGTKGKFRSTLDKALRSRWQEAFAWLMEGVAGKDPTCTRIYWDRVMPPLHRMAIELNGPDDKPLRIESPADARAAMAHVLSMVAAGELAGDEADELITSCAKYLAANSIHTIPDGDAVAAGRGEDIRKVVADKLEGIMKARAAAPIGFDIPSSEDQSPLHAVRASPRPADSIAAIRERMEAARQAPDADALAGLAGDLEALAARLEANNGHGDSE